MTLRKDNQESLAACIAVYLYSPLPIGYSQVCEIYRYVPILGD